MARLLAADLQLEQQSLPIGCSAVAGARQLTRLHSWQFQVLSASCRFRRTFWRFESFAIELLNVVLLPAARERRFLGIGLG